MLIMTENRPTVVPTIQIDNAKSRVTEWRFAPNAETGWHRHAYDYVVIPMVTGQLLLKTSDDPVTADLVTGNSYFRQAGVEYNVINNNDYEFVFVEVEIKQTHHN